MIRYAELFAGGAGLSLGLHRAGWECAFHAEWDANPRAVLEHRFPHVPLFGDVSTLDGRELVGLLGRIHILTGGSPCQDLSVAGRRAGLGGGRSSLFYQEMRLWQETGAPLCLWENVAGAFSSNHGGDFAAVLSAFVGATVDVPRKRNGRPRPWPRAGWVRGPSGMAAWRVLDCQYFGPPQRRVRVFVLGARPGGVDPREVLLEPEGVCGNPPARAAARERIADSLTVGANQTCGFPGDVVASGGDGDGGVMSFHHTQEPISSDVVVPSLGTTTDGMGVLHVCATGDVTHTLTHEGADASEDGTGRGTPIVAIDGEFNPARDGVLGAVSTGAARVNRGPVALAGVPRRLTPRECERLMGWPDDWTLVPGPKGKPLSDGARYKIIGNGVAAPVAHWIALRISMAMGVRP